MRIPILQDFNQEKIIGFIEIADDIKIPLDTVLSWGIRIEETLNSDISKSKIDINKGKIISAGLISDKDYYAYLHEVNKGEE